MRSITAGLPVSLFGVIIIPLSITHGCRTTTPRPAAQSPAIHYPGNPALLLRRAGSSPVSARPECDPHANAHSLPDLGCIPNLYTITHLHCLPDDADPCKRNPLSDHHGNAAAQPYQHDHPHPDRHQHAIPAASGNGYPYSQPDSDPIPFSHPYTTAANSHQHPLSIAHPNQQPHPQPNPTRCIAQLRNAEITHRFNPAIQKMTKD